MKESVKVSPFAALNPREQKEQWIWWQCQHPETVMEEPLDAPPPTPETKPLPETAGVQRELPPVPAPVIRHGQYDSVIRRMNQARRQTGDYIPCTGSMSDMTESGAGK